MLFLFFVCVYFCFLCLFLSVSYENHGFPCNSSVLDLLKMNICFCFLFCLLFV